MTNARQQTNRSSFCLVLKAAVLALLAQLAMVHAAPGGLRRSNRNRDNSNDERRVHGGLSDREEKIALAMEREYYRLHPAIYEEEEEMLL